MVEEGGAEKEDSSAPSEPGPELRLEPTGCGAAKAPGPGQPRGAPAVRLRLVLAPGVAIGPGKADLLAAIAETGSIAAAGRRLAMSYKRAWHLVEELNRTFAEPLVRTSRGGSGHGGALLTPLGGEVLAAYRGIEAASARAAAAPLALLVSRLAPAGERGPADVALDASRAGGD
jgi:molybdate transport system regulatory protein